MLSRQRRLARLPRLPRLASPTMSRVPLSCPLCNGRVILLGLRTQSRLAHSDSRRRPASGVEVTLGLVVIFTSFLAPCSWVLSHLDQYRSH